jgi:hypothetical protein
MAPRHAVEQLMGANVPSTWTQNGCHTCVSEVFVDVRAVGAADKDGVADKMNAHADAETPLCGLPDEEVMAVDAAPMVASSSKVLSLAAAAVSTGMASTVAVGDVAAADGVKAGAGLVASRLGHSVEQNVGATVLVSLGVAGATTGDATMEGARAGGSASPADARTNWVVTELVVTGLGTQPAVGWSVGQSLVAGRRIASRRAIWSSNLRRSLASRSSRYDLSSGFMAVG